MSKTNETREDRYRRVARKLYDCEIDEDGGVSEDDGLTDGAYVQAWVWVTAEEFRRA